MNYTGKQLQIIEVAERLFSRQGYNGTSVRDIAKEAGVNVAMVSYYFGSKENLLVAVFQNRALEIRMKIETMLKDVELSPLEKVYRLIDTFIAKMVEQQHFHKIMVQEQVFANDTNVTSLIRQTKKDNQVLVKEIINEGQKKGVFKKNIDIPLMMSTLVGTANHLITTQHFYKEINGLEDMPEEEFQKHLRKKLSTHLKTLFKAILTYEEQ